jgi:chromate reductase, NAD(P)H dehydrogenase (quinone)
MIRNTEKEGQMSVPEQAERVPDTTGQIKIGAIAGSLRAASFARSVLRAASKQLPPNVELTIWVWLESVPPFSEDAESGPLPLAVADLRALIERSDALLIATPEYNTSMPGVLKNALDWASRPYGASALQDKPVAAIGTSPLPTGAATALSDLKRVLTATRADVIEADLAIGNVHTRVDAEGRISDPDLAARVDQLLAKVVGRVADGRALSVA